MCQDKYEVGDKVMKSCPCCKRNTLQIVTISGSECLHCGDQDAIAAAESVWGNRLRAATGEVATHSTPFYDLMPLVSVD
jgi:lactam utilization protein B